MANNFFRFKQFEVWQQTASMKVCTDSCLFGAWVAAKLSSDPPKRVVDLGTGTGLLALMLLQKFLNAHAIGIENDQGAFLQAKENFERSPFSNRLNVCFDDFFVFRAKERFDLVISNPPFYGSNYPKSSDESRNKALQGLDTFGSFFDTVSHNLSDKGQFACLMPAIRFNDFFEQAIKSGWHFSYITEVFPSIENKKLFRVMSILHRQKTAEKMPFREKIYIHASPGIYSEPFRMLLQDYYEKL